MIPSLQRQIDNPLLPLLAEQERRRRLRARSVATVKAPRLSAFVEKTTRHSLDDWQHDLCQRLESLATTTGRRILIAAPPQFGKSIIVSQRFPAWLLGQKPEHRIKLACYNITHATKFGRVVRDLMWDEQYRSLFPSVDLTVPRLSSAEEWSTEARLKLRDSQPSFKALGLATGFVGQGADTLIVDDPYASPREAYSEIINASVHSFWSDTAKPRLNDDTNVVVMFHRYTENDLAGWLMEQEPDQWELIRYSAIADGDYVHPATEKVYADPMTRTEGEPLSPRRSTAWYAEQEANAFVWLSQFQGRPTAKEGSFFKVGMMKVETAAPVGLRTCRGWDLAATQGAGDFTAGVKIGKAPDGLWWIVDVKRGQWGADLVENELLQTAKLDGNTVKIALPQDPGQAGKGQVQQLTRMLAGFPVSAERISGDKETRAFNFAAQVNAGNVRLIQAPWNKAFIEELRAFPMGTHDDQCLVAGTMVQTSKGEKQIEDIRKGDLVLTRSGYERVLWAGMTAERAAVKTLHLSDGRSLTGTGNHPIFVEGKGFVSIDSISDYDNVFTWQQSKPSATTALSFGAILKQRTALIESTLSQALQIGSEALSRFIVRYGRLTMAQFLSAGMSIIRMAIPSITTFPTLSHSLAGRTSSNTSMRCWRMRNQTSSESTWNESEQWRSIGIEAKLDVSGIGNTGCEQQNPVNLFDWLAVNAAKLLERSSTAVGGMTISAFARPAAPQDDAEKKADRKLKRSVSLATKSFSAIPANELVPVSVARVSDGTRLAAVYNLTVENTHEYFANGVLVHNCDAVSDAFNRLAGTSPVRFGHFKM